MEEAFSCLVVMPVQISPHLSSCGVYFRDLVGEPSKVKWTFRESYLIMFLQRIGVEHHAEVN